MVKGVISGGEIRSLEPLPPDWREGQAVGIDILEEDDMSPEEIDRDFDLLDKLCAAADPEDAVRLERAILEARQEAKDQVRKEMGLK